MTNEELKKAWNKIKKAMVKKDSDLNGSFRMTAKQIANRTATVSLCNTVEYDNEIEEKLKDNEKVQAYTTWTDEEKANAQADTDKYVARRKNRKAMFKTKENEAKMLAKMITESKEFKEFQNLTGATTTIELTHLWEGLDVYYLRVNY